MLQGIYELLNYIITNKCKSKNNLNYLEVLLEDIYPDDEEIQDYITELALYQPGGGDYLVDSLELANKTFYILDYIKSTYEYKN